MRFSLKVIISFCLLALSASAFAQAADTNKPQPSAPPAAQAGGPPGGSGQSQPGGRRFGGFRRGGYRDGMAGADSAGEFSMSFDKADAASVVKFLSMISKVPIVVDPDLKGNITIISSMPMSLPEAYEVVNAALNVRGYVMVGDLTSKVIRVIPLKKAIVNRTGVQAGKELKTGGSDQDLVTQVVPLDYASSDSLATQLKPLVSSDQASLVSITSTNTLVITDNGGNVRRLIDVIKNVDKDTLGIIQVEVYQCKAASADNLATTLTTLFSPQKTTGQGQPGQPGQPNQPGQFRGGPQNNQQPVPLADVGLASLRGQVNFMSDSRTNRLIVSATRDRIESVMDVIKQLDVDTDPEVKIKFFPLQYADAQGAADMLNALFEQPQGTSSAAGRPVPFFGGGGGQASNPSQTSYAGLKRNVVVADVRTNSIIVTATDQNMKQFESAIKELDSRKDYSEVSRVYPLKYVHASDLAPVLTNLFKGPSNVSGGGFTSGLRSLMSMGTSSQNNDSPLAELQYITVIAEPKTNSLLVTGPPNSMPLMDEVVEKLDKRTAQVFIEVAIVDVTLSNENQFGVEWQWQDANSSATSNLALNALTTGLKYSILHNNVSALLQALQTRSDVKVLSTPSITTADNVQGKVTIGETVPYESGSTLTSGGNSQVSTNNESVAITLTVTPHVNGSSDVVGLDVDQVIDEIITDNYNDLNAPLVANREAQTTVNVKDGESIVIGGIIQESKNKATNGIPVLSSIPLIGHLFKSTDYTTTRTELMVFLTPHILKPDTDDVATINSETRKSLSVEPPSMQGFSSRGKNKAQPPTAPSTLQPNGQPVSPPPAVQPNAQPALVSPAAQPSTSPAPAPPAAAPNSQPVPVTPTGRS